MPYNDARPPYDGPDTYYETDDHPAARFGGNEIPQNDDAEKSVLAAMLFDKDICTEALERLRADQFFRPAHQIIFQAIEDLDMQGFPIDQLTVADRLETQGDLGKIGGKAYLLELGDNAFAIANWSYHASIIERQALLRDLIRAATRINALSYDAPADADEVVEEAEKLILGVTEKQVSNSFKRLSDSVGETYELLEKLSQAKSNIQGVPTGFKDIDTVLTGMKGGDLIVLAARPGVGKTAFALNMAVNAAKSGARVCFFSLEMPISQLTQRVLCCEARIDQHKMRNATLTEADWALLVQASASLEKLDFWIDETPDLSITELRSKARRQLRGAEHGAIFVDYLQLMESKSRVQKDRHLEVAEFSRGLKVLAKELEVPIVALSQLSRNVENRKGQRPMLSDLRESGAIEQDADVVMFIDRSLSEEEANTPGRPEEGEALIIIGKHRNGPLADVSLSFSKESTRFADLYRGNDNY